MIYRCNVEDNEALCAIINTAAQKYKGIIPADCWHEPYMPLDELNREIAAGVVFYGWKDAGNLVGVMGLQPMQDVMLIRHAYVLPHVQGKGIGGNLLQHLMGVTSKPVLVGAWASATWVVAFYERHGFVLTQDAEKNHLLKQYWNISPRQTETSVVLRANNSTPTLV
jgi:N-acetylglutamate synthase-like GNAT family acetyltransferase